MENTRNTYAKKAITQIPRLLGLLDRNKYSPTYGCFHRDYWLDKTSDFPDAVRQFAAHALALVYRHDFPESPYKNNPKIRDWTIASLEFWASIQHSDGSFDEFYPYERGWVGPTAFTTYSSIEALNLLGDEISDESRKRVEAAIRKAAFFISTGESERDDLANHHAMACLSVWKSYELLMDEELRKRFQKLWTGFLKYHNSSEGWSLEYDGVDPGYLSATVSFLSKIYQTNPDPEIFKVIEQSIKFCSYFTYPNGFYGGSTGSRNTLHFYPHGFEIMTDVINIAGSVADKMLEGLSTDKLVPPEIMSDRYVVYRVPEYLQSYLDYQKRPTPMPLLPYENNNLQKYFSTSGILVESNESFYSVTNLAKGGVIKIFDKESKNLVINDCGIIGQLSSGELITSSWINSDYKSSVEKNSYQIEGQLQYVPPVKLFTLLKNIIFRSTLFFLGRSSRMSHFIKGRIRKMLILSGESSPVKFTRTVNWNNHEISIIDQLYIKDNKNLSKVSLGDEFFVRYVPQSRYFQNQELSITGYDLTKTQINSLNKNKEIKVYRKYDMSGLIEVNVSESTRPTT